ncbi:MAG: patatin-like phospholipase family protein [Bacteroidaceae bacterium]|nr:patatin-like phospholipase family protein [Bacteroidaceae bacterium]
MKRFITNLILLITLPVMLNAQKVGLVMSGGGARGLAHIGVIKVLEENNIPIDYVAGTSMGAIVAALYSMGYTPDEMIEMMKTDDFQRWYTGTLDQNYMYYFKKNKDVPNMFSIHFSFKDSLRIVPEFSNIVNATPMNLGFLETFAGYTAACKGNFDNLMVPFRCVASDIYNKKEVIFSKGDLGDAVRASMTYPFFFRPIKVDNVLLYDGGLYNNFPSNVMQKDFNPDIIIGCVVSDNPTIPEEKDIMSQVENMIMSQSNYTLSEEKGILINMHIKGVNLLDFHKIDNINKTGYNYATQLIDSIKQRITRRENSENLAKRRAEFKSRVPELVFNKIVVNGMNKGTEKAITKEFQKENERFTYDKCKKGYYSLVSSDIIENVVPHAKYNEQDSAYALHLDVAINPPFTLKMGAGISTDISNQIYFGLHYRNIKNHSKEFIIDGQLGKVYNNVQMSGRIDFHSEIPISLKLIGSYSTTDYYNMRYLFSKENSIALNHNREVFGKIKMVLPFLNRKKAEIGIGIANIKDEYMPTNIVNLEKPEFDRNSSNLFSSFLRLEGNTLNAKVFPTDGVYEVLSAHFLVGQEKYKGSIDVENKLLDQSWLQICYTRRDHFKIASSLTLGTYLQLYYSTRRLSRTYQATMMQAGEFTPTLTGLFNYNPKFRANQYIAGGVIPIIKLNNVIQIRPGFYAFVPYRAILENPDGTASYNKKRLDTFEYIADITVAARLSNISVSAFANYYSSYKSSVNFGLTLGWFMFNERFIE